MSDIPQILEAADDAAPDRSAATRRHFVSRTAAAVGGLGLLGVPALAGAQGTPRKVDDSSPQKVLNVTATIERLGTIITTVGLERVALPPDVRRNVAAAARHELLHQQFIVRVAGGKPITDRFWIPDAVFSSAAQFATAIEAGETNEVNGYLIGTTVFARAGQPRYARIFAELVAVESVHRAAARAALGKVLNDRAWAKYDQRDSASDSPLAGKPGFNQIQGLIDAYELAGVGFGRPGVGPGAFYSFDEVSKRTPDDPAVNTRRPR